MPLKISASSIVFNPEIGNIGKEEIGSTVTKVCSPKKVLVKQKYLYATLDQPFKLYREESQSATLNKYRRNQTQTI